jgi:hypothetical protein
MSAAIYPTSPIYVGDSWPGIPSITIRPNGEVPADAVASAKMIFFKAEEGPENPAFTLESPTGIDIEDAGLWQIKIPKVILPLAAGEWTFRFSTIAADADDTVWTWLVGTLTIR